MPTIYRTSSEKSNPTNYLDALRGKKDEEALVRWANEQYKKCKDARGLIERQWYLNLAFYFGRQNVQVVSTTATSSGFKLSIPPAPPWRVRLVSNKIRPIIRAELAKVLSSKPIIEVLPATTEDEDIFSAQVGKQVFWDFYRRKKIRSVMRRAQWWNSICGTAFIKNYWDPKRKDTYGNKGDLCIEPIPPFYIFISDHMEEDIEGQPYVIHASTKSPEFVQARYGKQVVNNVSASENFLEESFLNFVGAANQQKNAILCLEVWVKPGMHQMFPNGGMFTVIGDQVVAYTDKWPYDHNEYPFIKLEHIPSGKFYGDSVVTDLIPLQREYNRTRSQIIEAKNLTAKPKLLAPRGSVNAAAITSEPGQVIQYTPGFAPPVPLQLTPLPSYVLDELQRIQIDMDDISGQHEVSRGHTPPGITAASAISYLQEQDDSKLSHTIDSIEAGIEKLGRHILSLVHQFWTTGRIVRVIGLDGSFSAQIYKGVDLKKSNEFIVEAGSAMPYSKAARQALIMDLMKMGFIDPAKGLSVLEIGGTEKLFEELQVDMRQAQRENLRIQTGQQVLANTWDNHQVHMAIHDNFRKSQSFEALSDEIKMMFQMHVQSHEQALMFEQYKQMMMSQGQPQQEQGGNPGVPTGLPGMMQQLQQPQGGQ